MSHVRIKRYQRDVEITLHTSTVIANTIRLDDMAGGVVSMGTVSTNAATLQMFGSNSTAGTFRQVFKTDGSAATITLTASSNTGRIYALPDEVFALSYLKILPATTNSTGTVCLVSLKS